jgi:hypothetical protein
MATTVETAPTVRAKEFHFPLSVEWVGGRRVVARAEGKPAIEIATPPVFRGTDPSVWSPEEFLVAAAASCLAVTFAGLAARDGLAYTKLKVDGDGFVGWPTGVGALLARREALARLERPWFSGGTVVAAFVQREWYESGELDEEQRVEASEPERLDREEVAGDHRVGVGTDELAPAELRASAGRGHASPP